MTPDNYFKTKKMVRKRLHFYALICYAIVSGLLIVRFFDSIQQNDKPKIMGAGIWLVVSIIAFISFLILYRKQSKNNIK